MRRAQIFALALALPATAALSQAEQACLPGPSGTVSDCTLDASPPIVEDFSEGEFVDPPERGTDLDVDLTPDDIEVGGVLPDDYDQILDPESYGFEAGESSLYYEVGESAVRIDPESRTVLDITPFSELGLQGVTDEPPAINRGDNRVDLGIEDDLSDDRPGVEVIDDDRPGVTVVDDELGLETLDDELSLDTVDEDLGLD